MADASSDRPSLRRAYHELAKRLHPDAGGSDVEMARLANAYARLAHPTPPPAGPAIIRAPRLAAGARWRGPHYSLEAEQFCVAVFRPQERLLQRALEGLEASLLAAVAAPHDPARAERLRDVAAQSAVALTMAGTRLAHMAWPSGLEGAREGVGMALRHLSDALTELEGEPTGGAIAALRELSAGRARLREAYTAMP